MEYTLLMKTIDIITFIYLTINLVKMLRIFIKNSSVLPIIYFIIYILYGYPILYNICVDGYNYPNYFAGFELASYDLTTQILANGFILILTFLITRKKNYIRNYERIFDNKIYHSSIFYSILWLIIALPILYVIFTGNLLNFLQYASVAQSLRTGSISIVYTNVFNLSLLSVVCMGVYIVCREKINFLEKINMFLFMFLINYFVGKRYILYFTVIVLILALYLSKKMSAKKIVKLSISFAILLIVYNFSYLVFFKNGEYTEGVNLFESLYIDLGRMDRLKMAIYSIIYPDKLKILEYPMETIIYNILFFIPRGLWNTKPYPYSNYFSYKVMFPNEFAVSYDYIKQNWARYGINGMTTGIIDEIIANMSWIGYIITPFIIIKAGRYIDKQIGVSKLIFLFLFVYAIVFCIDPVIFAALFIIGLKFKQKNNIRKRSGGHI